MSDNNLVIIGNTSDNPFAIDVAYHCGQLVDVSDVIALKDFQNTEFCPRFISDEQSLDSVGNYLEGKTVVVVSTSTTRDSRNSIAMRNLIIARAAKDNGAAEVVLVEPDLFYSCQDRGPRYGHAFGIEERSVKDRKKFDGQPFTALLNAELLKTAGVDRTVTVHNHSSSTQGIFKEMLNQKFHDFVPADLFSNYFMQSGIVDLDRLVLCAPDKGAAPFVDMVKEELHMTNPSVLKMDKERSGERSIAMEPSSVSEISIADVEGKDVIVFDDMVRTGTTIVKCCRLIREYKPRRIIFCVTHFHSSSESREKLNDPSIDEIVTTNTIPAILNRDTQGRLRKKIIVLKLERWVAKNLMEVLGRDTSSYEDDELYSIDMSSKHPRWHADISRSFRNHCDK